MRTAQRKPNRIGLRSQTLTFENVFDAQDVVLWQANRDSGIPNSRNPFSSLLAGFGWRHHVDAYCPTFAKTCQLLISGGAVQK